MPKNVLLFAPYGSWWVHHQVDAVVGAALALRGAKVLAFGCNGVFEDCPLKPAKCPAGFCRDCEAKGRELFGAFRIPYVPLGRFIRDNDRTECEQWAASVPRESVFSACFEGHPVGEWIMAGVVGRYHAARPEFDRPEVLATARGYLQNAALLSRIYGRLLEQFPPDHVICYNGGHLYYRVAFEMSRQASIPLLVHERSPRMGDSGFQLRLNAQGNAFDEEIRNYEHWRHVPLAPAQCDAAREFLESNERGQAKDGRTVNPFISGKTDLAAVRRALRIGADVPIVAALCSSDWEYAMDQAHCPAFFPSQQEGLELLADVAAEAGVCLVIRHHPGRADVAHLDTAFLSLQGAFNRRLPESVRVVMPMERFSSYALMWAAEAVVTFGSTTGVESLARGCASISSIDNYPSRVAPVRNVGSLRTEVADPKSFYRELLDAARRNTAGFGIEDLRQVYRSVYFMYFRNSFQFRNFGIKNFFEPDIRVTSSLDLAEGVDPVLDHVCRHILHGAPLARIPQAEDLARSPGEEEAMLRRQWEHVRKKRELVSRSSRLRAREPESVVGVLRLVVPGERAEAVREFEAALARSRLKPALARTVETDGLQAAVREMSTPYVWVGRSDVLPDESLLAVCVDALDSQDFQTRGAMLAGAYLERAGLVLGEVLTRHSPEVAPEAREVLLALAVWRREALLAALADPAAALLETPGPAHRTLVPMVSIQLAG